MLPGHGTTYNLNKMAISYNPRIITDGLVLYTDVGNSKSYPGSGTILTDLSGNGNTGTLVNGVGYTSDNLGSLSFDGINQRVTFGTQLDPIAYGLFADSNSIWSVSSWFLPDTTNSSAGAIVSKAGGTGAAATFIIWSQGSTLVVRLRGGTILNITTSLTQTWSEVVITWDGNVAKAYLNGLYISDISVGTAAKQTNTFCIGAAASGTNTFYKGNISNTKVFNISLSPAQIQQNFNSIRPRFGV